MEEMPVSEHQPPIEIVEDPRELGLNPAENPGDDWLWRASLGDRTLANMIIEKEQIGRQIAQREINHTDGIEKMREISRKIEAREQYVVNNKGPLDPRD